MLADACHTDLVSAPDDYDLPAISAYHRAGDFGAGEQEGSQPELFVQPGLFVQSGLFCAPEVSVSVTASHVTWLARQGFHSMY